MQKLLLAAALLALAACNQQAPAPTQTAAPAEVAADAACLVDPFDPASIRAGVLRVIGDPAYRNALIEAGLRNVQRFRVEVVAKAYADVYREAACVGRGGTDAG